MAGFSPRRTPSVGAFYSFLDRIEDGPFSPSCPHRVRPSKARKLPLLRNLSEEKANKEARRKAILAHCDSISHHLKQQLLASSSQPRPSDFQSRLEDILIKTAIKPSAQRGLLGDLDSLVVSGDGSALETGAASTGRPACCCRSQGIYNCNCPRLFSDHSADWGYDPYRETYYFGHTFYQHCSSVSGHDLPLHITIGPASESDFTLSLKSLDRMQKAFSENGLEAKIEAVSYDSGHDALGIYEYLKAKDIKPVIALNARSGHASASGTASSINDEGVPLCEAGLEMRRHSRGKLDRLIYNCPVKRPTHIDGKLIWQSYVEQCPLGVLCQPETKMGPVVYVRTGENPRLYPEIERGSARYKQLMKLRTGCERSNSVKKVANHLGKRVCRSATHYLVRLYLVSIIEHAKAWLAEDRKVLGNDLEALADPEKIRELRLSRKQTG